MKLIAWSSIEEDIVRTSKNRADAHKQLKAEGFKRTENSVWAKYRKMKNGGDTTAGFAIYVRSLKK